MKLVERKTCSLAVLFLLALSAALSLRATPVCSAKIEVSGYEGRALADFPVLVRVSADRFPGFTYADCAADGSDVRFVSADGEQLPFEVEDWNTQGESIFWVMPPTVEKGTTFYLTYSDESPAPLVATNIWSASGYAGVWHMGEKCTEGAEPVANSTTNADWFGGVPMSQSNKTTGAGAAGMLSEAGVAGTARKLSDGVNKAYFKFPSYDRLALGNTFTYSGWYYIRKQLGGSLYTRVVARSENGSSKGWGCQVAKGLENGLVLYDGNGKSVKTADAAKALPSLQNNWRHLGFVFSGTTASIYCDGELIASGTVTGAYDNNYVLCVGNSYLGQQDAAFDGAIDEMRLSAVAQDADWMAAEYATVKDSAFLTCGAVVASGLIVAAEPREYGVADPSFGTHAFNRGDRVICTVTAAVTNDGVVATCAGWTLRQADGTETSGEGNACEYVHADGATLTWNFARQYRVDVRSDGGTVDTNGVWFAEGETVTLTVTPDEGLGFLFWSGDLGGASATANPLVLTADGPKHVRAHCRRPVLYVATDGDDANDGEDPARPIASVQKAIGMYPAEDVWIAPGQYFYHDPLRMTNAVFLAGTGPGAILTIGSYNDIYNSRAISPLSAGCVISNITLCGMGADLRSQGGPSFSAGLVTDCVISNYHYSGNGVGAYMKGNAHLRRCLLTRNVMDNAYLTGVSGAIYLEGGIVENCIVVDNENLSIGHEEGKSDYGGGGVQIRGGTVRNCLIARNTHGECGAGVWMSGGFLENCTVIDNTDTTQTTNFTKAVGLHYRGGMVRNCLVARNRRQDGTSADFLDAAGTDGSKLTYNCCVDPAIPGETNISSDPAVGADGVLGGLSPCRDKGTSLSWHADARDVFGNPRVFGKAVDLGCMELQTGLGLILLLK